MGRKYEIGTQDYPLAHEHLVTLCFSVEVYSVTLCSSRGHPPQSEFVLMSGIGDTLVAINLAISTRQRTPQTLQPYALILSLCCAVCCTVSSFQIASSASPQSLLGQEVLFINLLICMLAFPTKRPRLQFSSTRSLPMIMSSQWSSTTIACFIIPALTT